MLVQSLLSRSEISSLLLWLYSLVTDLVGKLKDRFSHAVAHICFDLLLLCYLQESARERGSESRVTQVYLHKDFSHKDFVKLLKNEGMSIDLRKSVRNNLTE